MEDELHLRLKKTIDKLNQWEKDYYLKRSRLMELETKLALKKAGLIKAKKITGRNDMFREAQLLEWAELEYLEVRKAQRELYEIQSNYYPLKREWEFLSLIVNSKR